MEKEKRFLTDHAKPKIFPLFCVVQKERMMDLKAHEKDNNKSTKRKG
jgi:hypothetical protein